MPPHRSAQIDVQFPGGEKYSYGVVPFRRIELDVPEKPGLYSWHFRIPPTDPEAASAFLHRLFVSSSIEIQASSNLRQTWSGTLQSTANPFRGLDNEALRAFFFALAYPLYVGISRNLAGRLASHKKELTTWRVQDTLNFPLPSDDPVESDTADESRTFGRRLGAIFRETGFTGTDWLYVKHYTPTSCMLAERCSSSTPCLQSTMAQLRDAEWTFNTLFHPALGRR
jgi:hypothetical protein